MRKTDTNSSDGGGSGSGGGDGDVDDTGTQHDKLAYSFCVYFLTFLLFCNPRNDSGMTSR